jgi:hypothetical protein
MIGVLAEVNAFAESIGLPRKEAPELPKKETVEFNPYEAAISRTGEAPVLASGGNDPILLMERKESV